MYYDQNAVNAIEINEDTNFYVNENGDVVIVFPKYELTAGVNGVQEFVIETV